MVRSKILAVGIALLLALPLALGSSSTAFADEYSGWYDIIDALEDGEGGDEFIVEAEYNVTFNGTTQLARVINATIWVYEHIDYPETPEAIETWNSSYQIYAQIDPDWDGEPPFYKASDDCDGFAILLCALIRFSIDVPADRVWVACSGTHAVVQYIDPHGFAWTLDPTNNIYRPGAAPGRIKFNDEMAVYHGPPRFLFE